MALPSEKIKTIRRIYNGIRIGLLVAIILVAIIIALKSGQSVKNGHEIIQKTDTIILDS